MARRRKEPADISANLTSLIDVTFLLIVFFVMVSKINEVERWELELPQLPKALTEAPDDDQRAVINVIPAPAGGGVQGYRVGLAEFAGDEAGLAAMTAHLAGLYQTTPNVNINVRADRATHYEFIEPALSAVASAAQSAPPGTQVSRINLVVTKGP
jgi:biopolymer transport protein ExbD